MQMMPSLLRY